MNIPLLEVFEVAEGPSDVALTALRALNVKTSSEVISPACRTWLREFKLVKINCVRRSINQQNKQLE